MIVSLLYHLTRGLLSVSAVLLRGDTAKDAELLVLRHENAIRRRRRAAIFPITPATLLFWHRRLIASKRGLHPRR